MLKFEKVEAYYRHEHSFKPAINMLRDVVKKTALVETYKWNFPTYMLNEKNVLAICRFKHHFAIWFFNGVLLKDTDQVLENAQEGKTMAMRHWKFTSQEEINKSVLLSYINEAIEIETKGRKSIKKVVVVKKLKTSKILMDTLGKNEVLKEAFTALSPYKQKEYTAYITSAKRDKTKATRLEKIIPLIIKGLGLNDKYR